MALALGGKNVLRLCSPPGRDGELKGVTPIDDGRPGGYWGGRSEAPGACTTVLVLTMV